MDITAMSEPPFTLDAKLLPATPIPEAQAGQTNLALHTLGWKAFQDLCAQVCEEVLKTPVMIYREAQDGGQDATFTSRHTDDPSGTVRESATIQCKFSGDPARRLRPSDLSDERRNIEDLASRGLASVYYFITNMGVDAPIAAQIRAEIERLGVREVYVCGREWLTIKIRESARLRALVPRIYGLGDLSIILDIRKAEQTAALLGHLMPSLRTYVPTTAHREAVRVLAETGIVLLVGAPATGKSMIAAILATTALGGGGHSTFQLDGPGELMQHWNTNESGRFYWIDDAFGPNQLRSDYVDHWIAVMNKVKAALSAGNRFVLTSRQHIWREAKSKLSTRNHPQLADESAVVNVGALSPDERAQILYNHMKSGNQPATWKARLKPYLGDTASSSELLPEIARRLGDKRYTGAIRTLPTDLIRFVAEPKGFLKDTLQTLTEAQRAALTAIFLFRARLPVHFSKDDRMSLVCDRFGIKLGELSEALTQLDGSFTLQKPDNAIRIWTFAHPTIADALAEILRDRPDLLELYVHGTRVEVLLAEVVCEGAPMVRGAIVVPASCNELLVSRIAEAADEPGINRILFEFLANRASEEVLREAVHRNVELLRRKSKSYWRILVDPRIALFARLHRLQLLPDDLREEVTEVLEQALLYRRDATALYDESVMALFSPRQLLCLSMKLYQDLISGVAARATEIADNPDLSIEPSDNFSDLKDYVRGIESALPQIEMITDAIAEVEVALDKGLERVTEKWKKENESTDWEGEDVVPTVVIGSTGGRSIFSDVDN